MRSRQRIGEQHRKLFQRGDRASGLGRHACNAGDERLARRLGLILEPGEAGGIDQLQQAGALLVGQVRDEVLLGRDVGADVAALGGVEPVRVVLAWNGCDERVDDRGQRLSLQGGEFGGHGVTFLGVIKWIGGRR